LPFSATAFPYVCALSSTGSFLAEAGDETLDLFRVNAGRR